MDSLSSFFGHLSACVVEQLETAGFFSDNIPKSRLFVTVHDAVLHILHKVRHTEYGLVSKSVKFMLKFRFSVVIVVKSLLLIVGCDLHHPVVASRGQAAIFFVLQLLDALLLSIGHHPCLLPPIRGERATLTWRPVAMGTGAVAVETGFL